MIDRLRSPARYTAFPVALALIGIVASQNAYWMLLASTGAVLYILTMAFNLSYGYAGIFNLSIVAIYGIGAFISIYAEVHLGWNFWLTIPFSVGICSLVSILVGLPTRRLNELFLAIETLAFGLAVNELIQNWTSFSGGANGVYDVPVPHFFGIALVGGRLPYFWLCAIGALLAYAIALRVSRSGVGRQLIALREGPRVLASVGVSPGVVSLATFGLCGGLAGLAGVLYGRLELFVSLGDFSFQQITLLLLATILGGAGYLWGPVVGVVVLLAMDEFSLATSQDWELIYGVVILVLLFLGGGGIAGLAARAAERFRKPVRPALATSPPVARSQPEASPPASHAESRSELGTDEVRVVFGGTAALIGASISVRSGEIVGIIGPNGAGKTSLVNAISGDVRVTAGDIRLDGRSVLGRTQDAIVRRGIGRTFQSPQFVPDLSVVDNVMLAHDGSGWVGLLRQLVPSARLRVAERRSRAVAMDLLHDFGIGEQAVRAGRQQTYGALRIAEIVRNLMLSPRFLLLDEPGAGLTEAERAELAVHVRQVRDRGIGVLLIDHNLPLIRTTCDRVYALHHGAVVAHGTPDEVLSHPEVVVAYLGASL
jgi:branched-chain amino acid transport system permease protein